MRDELRAQLAAITDTFTGADGGVSYVRLRAMLIGLDQEAASGDYAATEVLAVVRHFARLIALAQRP